MTKVKFVNPATASRLLKLEEELGVDYLKFNLTTNEVAVIENNFQKAERKKLNEKQIKRFEEAPKTVLGEGLNAIVYKIADSIYANLKRSDKTFFLQLL